MTDKGAFGHRERRRAELMFLYSNSRSARRSNAAADVCSPAATENAALGDTICAERTACVKAISERVSGLCPPCHLRRKSNYCMPCGSCRQFLSEFNDGELEILCCKAATEDTSATGSGAAALYI